MNKGKVSEITYKRSILKKVTNKSDQLKSENEAIKIKLEDITLVMSSNCIIKYFDGCERFYLTKAVNGIYEHNAKPKSIVIKINIPEDYEEKKLGKVVKNIDKEIENRNLKLEKCQVYAGNVSDILIEITAYGIAKDDLEEKAYANMDIVMTKSIGIMGTSILSNLYTDKLAKKFPPVFVNNCLELNNHISTKDEAEIAWKNGANFVLNVSESGVFGALWDIASINNLGINVDIKKIPVWQETVEVTEIFGLNPYTLDGTGALLIATENGEKMKKALEEKGIVASVVGKLTDDNDRIITNGEEKRFLEPPRGNEIFNIV